MIRSAALRQPDLRYDLLSGAEQRRQRMATLSEFFLACDEAAEAVARNGNELRQALGRKR